MRRCGPVSKSEIAFSSSSVTPSTPGRTLITDIPGSAKSSGATGGGGGGCDTVPPYPPPLHDATKNAATRAATVRLMRTHPRGRRPDVGDEYPSFQDTLAPFDVGMMSETEGSTSLGSRHDSLAWALAHCLRRSPR